MPSSLDIVYWPTGVQANGSSTIHGAGGPSASSSSAPSSSPKLCFRLHLSNPSASVIEHLPFDDIISGLNLTPFTHYTAALYPNAVLVDWAHSTTYRLSMKNLMKDGRPTQSMVYRKLLTAHTLTLQLGEREGDEWERVQEKVLDDECEKVADSTPPPSTPASPVPSDDEAVPPPYMQLAQPAPSPFILSSSDVEVATVLCMAVKHTNPYGWLHNVPTEWRTPAVLSLLTEAGDRVLNVANAAQPYMLALSHNEHTVYEFGDEACQQQLTGDTLWVVFPSHVVHDGDSVASLSVLGRSSPAMGRVYTAMYRRIESIAAHIRQFAAEYRRRRQGNSVDEPWRIVFTGHSAGGMLAQLACMQLLSESVLQVSSSEQMGVISFASPLVVSHDIHSHLTRQGWNDHFLTIVDQRDAVPQLVTSALECDLAMQKVAGYQPQAAVVYKALSTLLTNMADKDALDRALEQLADVSRVVTAASRLQAGPTLSPIGVYAMIEARSTVDENWEQLSVYDETVVILNKLAKLSPGATLRVNPHTISSLCGGLSNLEHGQQSALFRARQPVAAVSSSSKAILQSLFKPTLAVLSVQVTSGTVLLRLSTNMQAFLRTDCHNNISWTVGGDIGHPNIQAIIPSTSSGGSSASLRVINDQQIELRIKATVDLSLLDGSKYSTSSLTLQTVFKQPACAIIPITDIARIPDSDNTDLRSLSDELLTGGLLRVYFEVTSSVQHMAVANDKDEQKLSKAVSHALTHSRKLQLYKELIGIVLDSDELGDELEAKLKKAVLTELKARKAALASSHATQGGGGEQGAEQQARLEQAKKEIQAAGSMSTVSRKAFTLEVKPLLDMLTVLLQSPASYELQPGWFRYLARGAFKAIKVTGYVGFAVAGVMVIGGVAVLGPAAWAGAVGVGAVAAEIGIDVAAIGTEAAIRYLVGSKGASLLANMQQSTGGDSGTAYRAHLLMLLATLKGKDDPHTTLFTANDVETAVLARLELLRPSLHEQLVDSRPATYVRSKKNSRKELKECWSSGVFKHSDDDRDASLTRFTADSQIKALRFLRAMACIHQLRRELSNAVYLSIVGAKDVGKSTLIQSLFGIPTKQGALLKDTTLDINMYPLFHPTNSRDGVERAAAASNSAPAFYLLDTPGMTDANEDVASAFRQAKAMVSMHLVLGRVVVGGARPETDILKYVESPVPALVILNALESYQFPPCYSLLPDGTVPMSFYRDHLVKLQHDAAIRLKVPADNIFLLYNNRLYSDSQHQQTRHSGTVFDALPYLKEHNIDALKVWLAERIGHHLHMQQHKAAITRYIDYHF